MKKSLIALAVLAATGAAMAQSSVTLYGKADIAIASVSQSDAAAARLGTGYLKGTQASANNTMNYANSRLGVKGTEDLGGGLKAYFNFEQAVNLANGATQANTWARAAFVALQGGFGEVYAGRRLSPHYFAKAAYDLTDTANWSVIGKQFGYGGYTTAHESNTVAPTFQGNGIRNDAMIGYTTPKMGGFSATLGTILSKNNGSQSKAELNLIYANGPIGVALGYDKTKDHERNVSLGGSYNFGPATLALSLQDPSGDKEGYTIGVKVPMGASQFVFDIARDNGTDFTKNTDVVLEYRYSLSRRTFLYAAYLRDGAVAGAQKVNGFSVGLDHNF